MAVDKLMQEFRKIKQAKMDKFWENVSETIKARLADPKPIGLEEYQQLEANNYERKALLKKYDNEVLLHILEYSFKQSQFSPLMDFEVASTYDSAIAEEYVPELMRRFKVMVSEGQLPKDHSTNHQQDVADKLL